jgi:hypothetical protein
MDRFEEVFARGKRAAKHITCEFHGYGSTVEKVRSAREGALRISRNLIRCCLLWGRKRPGSRLCPRACFFLGGGGRRFPNLGKERPQSCRSVRRITSRLRLIGSAWRRLIVRFLPASPARVFRAWMGLPNGSCQQISGLGTSTLERREKNTHTFGRRGWAE